jgi:hypothetical protein
MASSVSFHTSVETTPWTVLGYYLKLLLPDAQLIRYSCPDCFKSLWKLIEEDSAMTPACRCWDSQVGDVSRQLELPAKTGSADAAGEADTLIIWYDGPPPLLARPQALPNIHLDGVFSPMTLFTLLSKKFISKRGRSQQGKLPRWIVFDPHHRCDHGMLALAQILSPHLHLIDGDECLLDGDSLSLLSMLRPAIELPALDHRKLVAAEENLQLMLTLPGHRHAVSNVVGPLLLGFTPQQEDVAWVVSHLRYLLKEVGISTGGENSSDDSFWLNPEELTRRDTVEFILIDDQHRNGWEQVLCTALGATFKSSDQEGLHRVGSTDNNRLIVSVSRTADYLLDKLESLRNSDQRFKLRLGTADCAHEILLLDLRLFEGYSLQEEARFLSLVRDVAVRFRQREGLPWPGFSDEELQRFDDWLKRAVNLQLDGSAEVSRMDKTYLEALTLLPRVLALTDLSLPIVIFSSTGQREITEILKNYGNIITEFEKPRLFGYQSADIKSHTRAAFQLAVGKALQLCAGRKLCRNMLKYSQKAQPLARQTWAGAAHVELYIDESGSSLRPGDIDAKTASDRRFVLAGLLIAYEQFKGEGGPKALHAKMGNAGLRWWPEKLYSPYLLKRGPRDDMIDLPGGSAKAPNAILQEFLDCLNGQKALGLCLEYRENFNVKDDDDLLLEGLSDNRYRKMLATLLELLVFELLPELLPLKHPKISFSIFVATRVRTQKEYRNPSAIQRMRELWGYAGSDSYMRSVDEAAIFPILTEALSRRSNSPLVVRLEHARGVTLAYPTFRTEPPRERRRRTQEPEKPLAEGTHIVLKQGTPVFEMREPKWQNTRHQHYMADIIAGECRTSGARAMQSAKPWSELFKAGMYDTHDASLKALLTATRLILRGEVASALLELKNYNWDKQLSKRSASLLLCKRIADIISNELNGSDFVLFAEELNESGDAISTAAASSPLSYGEIAWLHPDGTYGWINSDSGGRCKFNSRDWISATDFTQGERVKFESYTRQDGTLKTKWVSALV